MRKTMISLIVVAFLGVSFGAYEMHVKKGCVKDGQSKHGHCKPVKK